MSLVNCYRNVNKTLGMYTLCKRPLKPRLRISISFSVPKTTSFIAEKASKGNLELRNSMRHMISLDFQVHAKTWLLGYE